MTTYGVDILPPVLPLAESPLLDVDMALRLLPLAHDRILCTQLVSPHAL